MAKFKILKDGAAVNTIEATEVFVMAYCEAEGCEYERISEPVPAPEPTPEEQLRADVDYIAAMTGVEL